MPLGVIDFPRLSFTPPAENPSICAMNPWWRTRPSKHSGRAWPCVVGIVTIPLIGLIDAYTGVEISVLVFYLPSIALVGWFGGSFLGIIAALEAAAAWLIADLSTHQTFSDPAIPYWNAVVRLAVFVLFGLIFAILRQNKEQLENAVAQKTSLLQKEITERARIEREVIDVCAAQQQRIAYDLHDGLGQHLSGIAFKAKLLEQTLRAEYSAQADEAAGVTRLINDALRQTRLLARNLESSYGETYGLKEGLLKLAEELRDNCRIAAVVNANSSADSVNALAEMQLFRIAQEAARNATEHGGARNVEINLETNEDGALLTVRDDGTGFESQRESEGMGLRIMRYRAQCVGGSLLVESRPGAGTTVSCRVPGMRHNGETVATAS